jgi:6-phosphogluconate dehydrogenase
MADLVKKLESRAVWLMVPAAITVGSSTSWLSCSSRATSSSMAATAIPRRRRPCREAEAEGIHYVDCGTSGGVFGLERGFCLMIGGEDEVVKHLDPIFKTIAPGVESAERTPGRTGEPTPAENGYLHCGPPGAGHFVKMVHNGVEYGLMAAYAEGLNIIRNADVGLKDHVVDAETTKLRTRNYQYEINIGDVARCGAGSVGAVAHRPHCGGRRTDPALDHLKGRVSDSGEGRWTVRRGRRGRPEP